MTRELFIDIALQFLKIPYKWGGDDTIEGFDCSGFAQELLASVGIDPVGDQTAQALFEHFKDKSVTGKHNTHDVGALIFFGKNLNRITHVGIAISDDTMIEAGGGGSKTTNSKAAADHNAYIRVRSISNRSDYLAALLPRDLPWLNS